MARVRGAVPTAIATAIPAPPPACSDHQVIDAEVIDAEVIDAEVIDAEVIDV